MNISSNKANMGLPNKSTSTSINSYMYSQELKRGNQTFDTNEAFDKHELDEVQKLKKLFLLYSSNESKLNSQNFMKLLSDAKILDKNFDSKYADIIFFTASRSKNYITFNEFCEVMIKISEIKFPNDYIKSQSNALEKIVEKYLFSLLELITESDKKIEEKNKQTFNPDIYLSKMNTGSNPYYILKHFYCVSKVYDKYFPWENLNVSNYQKSKLSEKTYIKLFRDFDISPKVVSLIKANEIFQNVMTSSRLIFNIFDAIKQNEEELELKVNEINNKGTYFTLYHLIACCYLVGVHNMCSLNNFKNQNIINGFSSEEDGSKINLFD